EDYYVFYNLITATAESFLNESGNYTTCSGFKFAAGGVIPLNSPIDTPGCVYIDPNPIGSINGEGHNYFRSKNPYKLKSYAAYGEAYWQVSSITKITAGLRYTDDRKTFTPVPSQVLLSSEYTYGGYVDRGYPALPDVKQHWGEVTGRLGVDWQPDFSFTDKTMIYAFYSRGYKGGGANPPGIGFPRGPRVLAGFTVYPFVQHMPYPDLFRPEFVNAFELGAKNTLLGGGLVFNGDVFFYDYADYQVSQIKERTAVNENFNAKVWGLELEALFAPTRNIRLNASLGYMQTKIGNGEKSIDLMNRTQGNPDWVLLKPWIQLPSNCIAPKEVVVQAYALNALELSSLCPGYVFSAGYHEYGMFSPDPFLVPYWGVLQVDQREWPNFGQGFDADLGGNQLPNAPHWTINFGAQYSHDLFNGDWRASVRADAYWQSQSWARVYNLDPYDKLHGWYNVNLSVWLERPEDDLKIEFYAKNLLDKTPITDAFLNSDDTALTTNVFTLDPRLIGLSIKKGF
ncbi:MAG: TonB-dependent receptor domain-containing protein, partial [Parcubacteria group bacterium]